MKRQSSRVRGSGQGTLAQVGEALCPQLIGIYDKHVMPKLQNQRIVLCFPVEPRHIQQIQQAAPRCEVIDAGQQGIATEMLTADLFCGHAKVPVPWDEVVSQGRLQWIQSSAAGLDHCLVPSVIDSSIAVTSASGLFADQVAEQAMALLLGLVRAMPTFYEAERNKQYIRRPTDDLHGKTVGIVGFGGNGQRIAEVLSPFHVRIVATDVFPVEPPEHVEAVWSADELPKLLSMSDVVILCVPLSELTTKMLGKEQLARMRDDAYLINVARGQVIDEDALIAELQAGRFAGAGLDVAEVEPLSPSSPLWEMTNVSITPHVGAQAKDRVDSTVDFYCMNLKRYEEDQPLLNLVDKQLGFPRPEHRSPLSRSL